MTANLLMFTYIMSSAAIMAFITQRQHMLMALLSLEAIILSLALLITLSQASPHSLDLFFCLVILTFGACEASLALAILVMVSRSYGNDMLSSLTSNKC